MVYSIDMRNHNNTTDANDRDQLPLYVNGYYNEELTLEEIYKRLAEERKKNGEE